jgi:hypothetical protein
MNRQMQGFVDYVRTEMLSRMQQQTQQAGLVHMPRPMMVSKQGKDSGSAIREQAGAKAGRK